MFKNKKKSYRLYLRSSTTIVLVIELNNLSSRVKIKPNTKSKSIGIQNNLVRLRTIACAHEILAPFFDLT